MKHKDARTTKRLDFTLTNAVVTKSASGTSDDCLIEGYANTKSKDRVGDVVLPEAFAKNLDTYLKNPVLLANHDWNDPCGVVLEAKITEQGLWIKARVSDTRPDIKTLVREGCLRTFSIGYNEVVADFDEATNTKYIKELELLEISIVTVPANTEAMFTQATAKAEEPDASKPEGKSVSPVKTAAELVSFIKDVKEAVESELNETQVLAVCEYFNDQENEMKQKQMLELLRGAKKSAELAAPASQAPKAEEIPAAAAPAAEAEPSMKEIKEMLTAMASALATVVEKLKADESAEAPKAEEEPKAEEPKSEESEEDSEEEMSEEDIEKELADIDAQISALEDESNE